MLIDVFQPIGNVVECLFLGAVIHQDDAHGSLVICLRYCSESFLACCVPHLQLHPFVLNVDGLDLEVNTYMKLAALDRYQ